jgi:putative restriction endonuclease
MKMDNWTKQELIIAFNLYCKLPFGQYHKNNNKVIEISEILGRSPSAVAMKLCNFARLDPAHQKRGIRGMTHGGKLEEKVWNEFNQNWEELAYQSEIAVAELKGIKKYDLLDFGTIPEGKEKSTIVKVRINQNFFRQMILANYKSRCSICSLPEANLLVAGHIIPWAANIHLRMNPKNGICMCVLHEKAFDKGLITINGNYEVVFSAALKKLSDEIAVKRGFLPYEGNKIKLPDKFIPEKKFLEFHERNIFQL